MGDEDFTRCSNTCGLRNLINTKVMLHIKIKNSITTSYILSIKWTHACIPKYEISKMIWSNVNFIIHKLRQFNAYKISLYDVLKKDGYCRLLLNPNTYFSHSVELDVEFDLCLDLLPKNFLHHIKLYKHTEHCRICFKVLSNISFFIFCFHKHCTFESKINKIDLQELEKVRRNIIDDLWAI